ncbi:LURP-one-related/scramblase family protein [Nocardia vaccinii]|uniref:LURP-one-related/scramblase family protein n=1 Tax=Nocardia vaccinii TaxID=1822 RepID=UPI00083233C1|nr:LURP-one-related family protein [Nocardia vaccinii]
MRYVMRQRVLGFGQDYWVTDESGNKAFLVDGKVLTFRRTFELRGPRGEVYAAGRRKILTLRNAMVVSTGGSHAATVRKKLFSPLRHSFTIALADGERWTARGDLIEKNYTLEGPQGIVAETSRRWFRIRDSYGVEIYHPDVPLALAIVVCVDEMVAAARESG